MRRATILFATLAAVAIHSSPALAQIGGIGYTPPSSAGPMKVAVVSISAAEVLALDATPKLLLPAVSGAAYMPWAISIHKAAGTAYANIAAGDDLILQTTSGTTYTTVETTGLLDQASAQSVVTRFAAGTVNTALADVGLQIKLLGPIDTGNCSLVVKLVYWEARPDTASN